MKDEISYKYMDLYGYFEENRFDIHETETPGSMPQMLVLLPLEDYNKAADLSETLESDEVFVRSVGVTLDSETLILGDQTFEMKELKELPFFLDANVNLVDTVIAVVPTAEDVDEIAAFYNPNDAEYLTNWLANIYWSTDATDEENLVYADVMNHKISDHGLELGVFYSSRDANREEWLTMNGGFLFLGLFLGGLFTIGAALITYFKQVSEGYDDRERIQIMQKVGLDKEMTRKATRSQIVWMFILPILVASLHTVFAFPMLQKMLVLFGITSKMLLLSVTIGVVIGFALLYWIIYRITSKVYLNIVE